MTSILIDGENQNEADEMAIDNSKVDLLKSNASFIYFLFNTSLEYGSLVQPSQKVKTKNMQQWVSLNGTDTNRAKAKKYISSLCNPQFIHHVDVNELLIERLKADDFKNQLIRDYQTNLSVCPKPGGLKIIIEGSEEDVKKTHSILEIEMKKLDKSNNKMDEDDDVVLIDPYELFDSTNQIRRNRKMENFDAFKLNEVRSQKSVENQLQNLQVNAREDLIKVALEKKFKLDEIHKGIKDLGENTAEMGVTEFINYLKSSRGFNPTTSKETNDLEIIEISSGSSSSSSLTNSKNKSESFFKAINFNRKDSVAASSSGNEPNTASLLEYAYMFSAKEFDEENEKTNKTKRISKLIAAMPNDEQKAAALFEFKNQASRNYSFSLNSEKKSIQKKIPDENNEIINNDENSDSIMIIDEPSPVKPVAIHPEQNSFQQFSLNVQPTFYNPVLYQDHAATTSSALNSLLLHDSNQAVSAKINTKNSTNFNNISNNNNNNNNNNKNRLSKVNKNFKTQRSRSNSSRHTNDKNNNNRNYSNINLNTKDTRMFTGATSNSTTVYSNTNNSAIATTSYTTSSLPYNLANLNTQRPGSASSLRFIVIDGSNVAREHGRETGRASFSSKGIKIVVEYFLKRGHTEIKALVPRYRRGTSDHEVPTTNPEILDELEARGYLTYTPSRYINNKLIIPYDDRFILKTALHFSGIIVSNDNYRDLQKEDDSWKKHIEECLLQYSFIGDLFLVADDPMGRRGPNLDQFLSFKKQPNQQVISRNDTDCRNRNNASIKTKPPSASLNHHGNTNNTKRNVAQTTELHGRLIDIFPNNEQSISKLLNQNPFQIDINFFTTKILDG